MDHAIKCPGTKEVGKPLQYFCRKGFPLFITLLSFSLHVSYTLARARFLSPSLARARSLYLSLSLSLSLFFRTHTNSLTHTHKNSWQPGHIHIQILLHLHTQTHLCTLICTATLYLQNIHTPTHTHQIAHVAKDIEISGSVRDCGTHPEIGM